MVVIFEGKADDLLYVSDDNAIKCTRLVDIDENTDPEVDEVMDVCITSSAPNGKHTIFDKFLGKKITVEISVCD